MARYVALLRAVNLGGGTQVAMEDLRRRFAAEGFEDVRTLLQSGNVTFSSDAGSSVHIERELDSRVAPRLGATTEFFVRREDEWATIIGANPFPAEAIADPGHLVLTVLKKAPRRTAWAELTRAIPGRERAQGTGREAYLVYPDGIGTSKLTARRIEQVLGTRGTGRNWNTVLRIATALAAARTG